MLLRAMQNESVDALCYRHYGSTQGQVERVLIANPGLADFGVIVPEGMLVDMPDSVLSSTQKPLINLWD